MTSDTANDHQDPEAVAAAMHVLDEHMAGLNSRDRDRINATLHFPHYRLSGVELKCWQTPDSYFVDFKSRAGGDWAHSRFNDIQVVRASENKVHLDAEINRFNGEDQKIASFRSLWVITLEEGRWAAKFRSSFAAR